MPEVTCDSVLGTCFSDETLQQGGGGVNSFVATVRLGAPSYPQQGWQVCIIGPVQATASAGNIPIVHIRISAAGLEQRNISAISVYLAMEVRPVI